jgi:hypothetical protein
MENEKLNEELRVIKSCLISLALAIEEGRIDGVVEEIQYTLGHVKRVEDLTQSQTGS